MAVADELKIIIRAETAKAVREMKKAQRQTGKTETGFRKMLTTLAKSAAGYVAAAASIRTLVRAGKEMVELAGVQERAEKALEAAIISTGREASVSADAIQSYAAQLQQVTTYGDEATIQAAALVQQLADLSQGQMRQALPAIQDFASALGMDLSSAARLVAQTIGGTTNTLSRYGIQIDNSLTGSERFNAIIGELNGKFDGFAEAMADTASGALTQFNNALGDLKELGGQAILDFIEPAVRGTTRFVEEVTAAAQASRDLRTTLSEGVSEQTDIERINNAISEQTMRVAELNGVVQQGRAIRGVSAETINSTYQREVDTLDALVARRAELIAVMRAEEQERRGNEQLILDEEEAARRAAAAAAALAEARRRSFLSGVKEGMQFDAAMARISDESMPDVARAMYEFSDAAWVVRRNMQDIQTTVEPAATALGRFIQALNVDTGEDGPDAMAAKWVAGFQTMGSVAMQTWSMIVQAQAQAIQAQMRELDRYMQQLQSTHERELAWAEARGASDEELAELRAQQLDEEAAEQERVDEEKRRLQKEQFAREKKLNIAQTIANTAAAVAAALKAGPIIGPVLAGMIGALGAKQLQIIKSTKPPAFERGGSFVTDGPQHILVGDGQSPRERVTVEPLTGPYARGGGSRSVVVNVAGVIDEGIAVKIKRAIESAEQRGAA